MKYLFSLGQFLIERGHKSYTSIYKSIDFLKLDNLQNLFISLTVNKKLLENLMCLPHLDIELFWVGMRKFNNQMSKLMFTNCFADG